MGTNNKSLATAARLITGATLLLGMALLSACGGTMVERGYKGEALPHDQVGRLIVEPPMQLRSLNGDTSLHKHLYSDTIMGDKRVIELKPGFYKGVVYLDYKRHWSELDRTHEYSKGDLRVQFGVLAGHLYKVKYQRYSSGVVTASVEEITDWDKINDEARRVARQAWAAFTDKRYAAALPLFQKATALDSKFADAYYGSGVCHSHLKHYRTALEELARAVRLKPGDPDFYIAAGIVYGKLGMAQRAADSYTDALTFRLDPVALYNAGYYDRTLGHYDKALGEFTFYLRLYPADRDAYLNRALIYDKLGYRALAAADREKARSLKQ